MRLIPGSIFRLPESIGLADDEVHLWQRSSLLTQEKINVLAHYLSPDEQQRACQFVFEKDRHQFIVARGLLRYLLGIYTQIEPSQLLFAQGQYGKPCLTNQHCTLEFNVSHAHGLVLMAITNKNPVGIDIELMRNNINADAIAKRFFSVQEFAALADLPPAQKMAAFFKLWTKKEAIIKMWGTGLYHALDEVDTNTAPDRFLHELLPATHYAGALCTQQLTTKIQYLHIE